MGKGGEGSVWLAANIRTCKLWAIKEIHEAEKKEAGLWRKLNSRYLVQIVDVFEREGKTCLIMEYAAGKSLGQILEERGRLSLKETLEYGEQLCSALTYLHTRTPPLLYGDMKPANIICRTDGSLVLVDFGSLSVLGEKNQNCFGTRDYAAPEQFRKGAVLDAGTDIYSLGATLYHFYNGNPPGRTVKKNRAAASILSGGLDRILQKCLEPSRDKRYGDCRKLEKDLKRVRQNRKGFCIAAAVTAVICMAAGEEKRSEGQEIIYERYLAEGTAAACQDAISMEPDRPEAYLCMLDRLIEDGKFTMEEEQELWEAMENVSCLEKDQDGYVEVCYQAGMAYWYYYTENGGKKYAVPWFEKAAMTEKGKPENSRQLRARIFAGIGKYYEALGEKDVSGDKNKRYRQYWEDLEELMEINISEMDNNVTQLRFLEEVMVQIYTNCAGFRDSGVGKARMLQMHDKAEEKYRDMVLSEREDSIEAELGEKLEKEIELASEAIERTYGKVQQPGSD